jgi:hypothetical protein
MEKKTSEMSEKEILRQQYDLLAERSRDCGNNQKHGFTLRKTHKKKLALCVNFQRNNTLVIN